MLDHHYAPSIPVSLESIHHLMIKYPLKKIGYLAFSQESSLLAPGQQMILSPSGDLAEAAQNFFSHLRALDKLNLDIIAAELVPDVGLGRAINDKLRRSAVKR
jgi:L-threonylcarbamoyladenylate synthase